MKYYSTQRPITPGSYPKPETNQVMQVVNFDTKTYCEEISREAWGYIDYQSALDPEDAIDYELMPVTEKVKEVKYIGTDSWGRQVFHDENGKIWKYTEPGEMPQERHDRLYSSTNNSFDGEPCWPMLPTIDYKIVKVRGDEVGVWG